MSDPITPAEIAAALGLKIIDKTTKKGKRT